MWYTSLIEFLAKIGNFLLDVYRKRQVKKEIEEKQDERDLVERNPADWFNEHFDGVRTNTTEAADGPAGGSTTGADQADVESNRKG